jgi:ribosome-binding protein aMBF1 (putative translation factor)
MPKKKKSVKRKAAPVKRSVGRPPKEQDLSTYQGRFGAILARRREAAGLSRDDAADAAGVTYNAWSKWENGQFLPTIPSLRPIAKALGCTVDELLPE